MKIKGEVEFDFTLVHKESNARTNSLTKISVLFVRVLTEQADQTITIMNAL